MTELLAEVNVTHRGRVEIKTRVEAESDKFDFVEHRDCVRDCCSLFDWEQYF
jgi:hypothetical protein